MVYKDEVPIIILNWNNAPDTIECIESVFQQREQSFHIYLIDNASSDSDRKILKDYLDGKSRITFVQNESNLGFGQAHNMIFSQFILGSGYKYVVLLNNDTVVDENWLRKLIICAEEEHSQMVSCKMIQFDRRSLINNLGHKFQNTGDILPIGNNEPEYKFVNRFPNSGPSGGAALYSVEMLENIGLFDPYFFCGYEDAELGLRGVLAGCKSVVEPQSVVYHKVGVSVNKVRDYNFTLKIQLDILYTYYTLMPWGVVLANLPFILFRNFALLVVSCLFLRFKYVGIYFHGRYIFFSQDIKKILQIRKERSTIRKLSSFQILKLQEFFLLDNIKRFHFYFMKGNKTIFERY